MMKYLLLALAVTAVSAQNDDADLDAFLEADMALPCTPKPCVPVCRPVTKYLAFGSFKIPYVENVCAPDHKCLAAAAACVAKLQAAMADAHKKGLALEAASKAKNAAHASKASKDKAAAARKAEAAAAATALGLAKAAFEAAEKEAANAKAAKESASKMYTAKAAVMDARLKSYEKAQQAHKNAVAAYDGAKSEAAKAAAAYAAAVKAHCDAEAQHAAAVKNIGHGHLAQKNCAKYAPPTGCSRAGWQSASFGFISNAHNLPGTPVRNKTLQQCIDVCKANASCKAFSYEKGKSRSNCWLKKALTHHGNKIYSTQRWYTYIVRC
jgi:flagellar hook-length control protein FliK